MSLNGRGKTKENENGKGKLLKGGQYSLLTFSARCKRSSQKVQLVT